MKKNVLTTACAALAAVVMVSGFWMTNQTKVDTSVPQLVSYVDSLDGTITIEGEETPLAAKPVVKKKTTTKKSTKKVKMPTKAKKSSKKTSKKTVKTSNTKVTSTQKVKTDNTILTTVVTSLKKKSNVKTIKTTVKTTTQTTTTKITAVKNNIAVTTANKNTSGTKNQVIKKTVALKTIAPKAHANVLSAYEKMGFSVYVDSTVSYSGKFDARAQLITVQKNSDDAIYHELGHFVAFVASNVDQTAEFKAIYDKEKSNFQGTRNNDAYIKSTAAEYFAESYQDYVERPDVLKSTRPQTYKYIVEAVSKVTDARASFLTQLYASIWK